MSLALGLIVAAGGVAVGRWLARSIGRPENTPDDAGPRESVPAPPANVVDGLPCHLGDVIVRTAERDEAWLAAALVFEEQGPMGALFVAPEAGADRAVFARQGTEAILWLTALGEQAGLGTEPPSTFEHEGLRYQRIRRLPVRAVRQGAGAPSVGDRAVVAEYDAPNDARLLIVAGGERALAWAGVVLEKSDYDVLPGGKATLE
ncbi:MAG TPA: hypothetical protein VGM06_17320 [Polyangiaceae bacterium]|jgi:hypothetical protein